MSLWVNPWIIQSTNLFKTLAVSKIIIYTYYSLHYFTKKSNEWANKNGSAAVGEFIQHSAWVFFSSCCCVYIGVYSLLKYIMADVQMYKWLNKCAQKIILWFWKPLQMLPPEIRSSFMNKTHFEWVLESFPQLIL